MNALASVDFVLEPMDNERLANLCGQFDEHLRQVERRLGVEIANRSNSFRVIGDAEPARAASEVLKKLYAQAANEALTPEAVHLSLSDSGVEALLAHDPTPVPEVIVKTKRGPVRGRGSTQQRYLAAMQQHDLSFGIGPAGTGKTYLAVASAVDALEREAVRRIVLVRPAEGRSLPAADVRRAVRDDGLRGGGQAHRAPRHRGRAARVHARPHPQRVVHHPRRGPEHHRRADEDVPDPHRFRLQGRGDG
jgi:hypothetical protein